LKDYVSLFTLQISQIILIGERLKQFKSVCAFSEVCGIFRQASQSKKNASGRDYAWPLSSVHSSVTYYYWHAIFLTDFFLNYIRVIFNKPYQAFSIFSHSDSHTQPHINGNFIWVYHELLPVPVAALSKAQFCGRSLAGIVGSNLTGDMEVCLL